MIPVGDVQSIAALVLVNWTTHFPPVYVTVTPASEETVCSHGDDPVVAAITDPSEKLRSGNTTATETSTINAETTRTDLKTAPFTKWNTSAVPSVGLKFLYWQFEFGLHRPTVG